MNQFLTASILKSKKSSVLIYIQYSGFLTPSIPYLLFWMQPCWLEVVKSYSCTYRGQQCQRRSKNSQNSQPTCREPVSPRKHWVTKKAWLSLSLVGSTHRHWSPLTSLGNWWSVIDVGRSSKSQRLPASITYYHLPTDVSKSQVVKNLCLEWAQVPTCWSLL